MTTFTTDDREEGLTVNELAVYLEDITDSEESAYRQAATMLRQQQAEIEALKEALNVKVILNEHAQQSMKEVKDLLRKAQEK
jgi:transcription elongation GreA/GreB family factor